MKIDRQAGWTIDSAKSTYGIENWGNGYFDINAGGEVIIKNPSCDSSSGLSLLEIIEGLRDRDLHMPALLRIENIIDHSISKLNNSFNKIIDRLGYQGQYRGVFPIKVNQQAQIVEEVAQFGVRYSHGFEVGSKPEMIAALSTLDNSSDQMLICNGYKDQEFVDLALQAVKLGTRCFVVIEALAELPIIIERSKALGIEPLIGVRAKMTSKVGGHWNSTSGDRSVFGLSASQIIQVVDVLKDNNMLHCLQLLHCHLGSQIPNIRDIRGGVNEACRYYADLCKEGAAMNYIDLGGGLAVDYTGAHSQESQSRNYSLDEYCEDVVETIMSTLDAYGIRHPTIVTESGRATVAYSSILLFNILDVTRFEPIEIKTSRDASHELLDNMRGIFEYLKPARLQECFNDAHYYRDEIRELFKRGQIGLRTRAEAENLFLQVLHQVKSLLSEMDQIPKELEGFDESLADIYYGNFSLFQSLPDSWAIDQMFPVMPVHRLQEAPDRRAVLADITCDCDGKIDRFIATDREYNPTLPLHSLQDSQEYYLGVFLVGAYQETLGDLHNLFGDTNVASIRLRDDGGYEFVKEIHGDTIEDVLGYVEYQPWEMKLRYRNKLEAAVNEGRITARERQQMMNTFNASMQGYTYYEKDHLL
ncbi:biosynthetic arginine decarboxylase [Bacterioplanoides sp. SCSIO 12839]|uniref:biosynthetic arginine decarboxylase n=1 Tax=Bacterioplanoides sp. SCSIO 12839 TaxID=2829569 RepID=UPI002103F993|nr:biosynthetic arginine decarboxylase [Bacterioplanoides sp. SCSIO 12839]